MYSDLVSPTGGANVISNINITPFGNLTLPTSFDEVATESDEPPIPFDGGQITPAGAKTSQESNGLPPADVAIQGTQEFDMAPAPSMPT